MFRRTNSQTGSYHGGLPEETSERSPSMLVHLLKEEAGWELEKIMNSVLALKLYDLC